MVQLGPKLPPLRTTVTSPSQDEGPAAAASAAPVTAKIPWVLGLCSVIFDVDKGQTLQDLWPPDCLSEEDKAAVAFHAFPDSLSMELYTRNAIRDSSFTFRIKREPETLDASGMPEFLYGYVFCRQRQDESLRRGGEQVSVLVLAATPFSGALLPLSQAAGHAFFNEGPLALTLVYNKVLSWPPPIPGSSMCLPIGAGVINVRLPHFCIIPPPQPTVDPSVQASLPRRMSRSMSRKASGSPRIAAAQSGSAGSAGSGELASMLGAAAAADAAAAAAAGGAAAAAPEESEWALVPGPSQQPEPGMSSRGSASSLSGSRVNSSSRLSRPDLAGASSGSGTNLTAAGAAAADGGGGSNGVLGGGTGSSGDWPSSSLGQQWRDEKPFPEVEPALVLAPLLRDLWTLWQLVVTGQPLLVVGLSPGETSAAVAALVSLIAPLPYAADFRPYFTIHDPDFVALASGQLPQRTRYHEVLPPKPQQQQQQGQEQHLEQQDDKGKAASCQPGQQAEQQDGRQQQQQPGAAGEAAELSGGTEQQEPGAATAQQEQQQQQQQEPQGSQEQGCPQQQQQQHRPAAAAAAKRKQQFHLPALIGITNLYFIKALPKWPNVVAVSKKDVVAPSPGASSSRSGSPAKPVPGSAAAAAAAAAAANGDAAGDAAGSLSAAAAAAGPTHVRSGLGSGSGPAGFFSSTAAAAMRALQRRHQGPQHLLSHFAPHLWTTRHTQCVKPDHALLSKARAAIEPAVGSSGGAGAPAGSISGSSGGSISGSVVGPNSAAGTAAARLRRHFADLTVALLAPFEVYFTPGPTGKVPAWRPEAFLASLDPSTLSPVLTARLAGSTATSAAALYAAFVESPNFAFWFKQRRAPVLHLVEDEPESDEDEDGFSKVAPGGGDSSDTAGVQSDPDEVELVQQLLSTEQDLADWQQLGRAQKAGAMPRGWQQQEQVLQLQVVQTFLQLPRDMQTALFSSPARQAQLQEAAAVLAAGSSAEQAAAAAVLHKMQDLLISTTGEEAEALPAS